MGYRIICVLFIILLGGCHRQQKAPGGDTGANVEIVSVALALPIQTREFTGKVEQTGIAPLAPEVSGRVIEIAVRDGQRVRQGQVLARIDPEPYKLVLQRVTAQYRQLADDLARKSQLRDENILSQAAFEQQQATTEAARVQMDLARRDLRNTRVLAPFDGRLAGRSVELWQTVQAGVPAFNLENMQRFEVSVDLPQAIVGQLPLNSSLKATAWLPERPDITFALSYREHATQNTAGSGVFRLVLSGQPSGTIDLLAGMSMRVRLEIPAGETSDNILSIPMSALIVGKDGTRQVWRVNPQNNTVQKVPVLVREIRQGNVLLTGNLRAGDKIVGAGAQFLHEGQRVHAIGQPA